MVLAQAAQGLRRTSPTALRSGGPVSAVEALADAVKTKAGQGRRPIVGAGPVP